MGLARSNRVRLVIDTNEAHEFLDQLLVKGTLPKFVDAVVVSPFVIAEMALNQALASRLVALDRLLRRGELLLAKEPAEVFDDVARLESQARVASYEPFLTPEETHELQLGLIRSNRNAVVLCRRAVKKGKQFTRGLIARGTRFRAILTDPDPDVKLLKRDPVRAIEHFAMNGGADFLLLMPAKNRGARKLRLTDDEFLRGASMNPYLCRHQRTLLMYILGSSSFFVNSKYWSCNPARNDWTDMTLGLYLRPGDAIATSDKVLKRLFEVVDCSFPRQRKIKFTSARELWSK
jgi:hypothetical protein